MITSPKKDITLEELSENEWLSNRAVNLCRNTGLDSLNLILEFKAEKGSFMKIRNCGTKTEKELNDLCLKYEDYFLISIEENEPDKVLEVINSLTPFQKSILNRHIEFLLSTLNLRAYYGIGKISKSYRPKEVIETIFSREFSSSRIPNIGNKSISELENFNARIIGFVAALQALDKEHLIKEYLSLVVKSTFYILPSDFDEKIDSIFHENGKVKLFALLKYLLENKVLFSDLEYSHFLTLYTKGNDVNISQNLAKNEPKLSREGLRRLRLKFDEGILKHFQFITNFDLDDFVNYGINPSKEIQIIDNSITERINKSESVNFTKGFYIMIFSLFLKKTHVVLKDNNNIIKKRGDSYRWTYHNCYLISQKYARYFDFEGFIEDVHLALRATIEETYSIHFHGFMFEYLKGGWKPYFEEIKSVCEAVIFNEFELLVSNEGYIIYERNTKKPIYEYFYELLEFESRPMTIDEMEIAIKRKYPELEINKDSLRSRLIREREIFMFFGRSSTYGLRKWEKEKENMKGGTIRELVEEFLSIESSPKHISEILEYVIKYRPDTNKRSVLTNIKVDERNGFCFFGGDFVGLKSKSYLKDSTNFKRLVGSHFRNSIFDNLIGQNVDKVVSYFVENHGYEPVQVRAYINEKIAEGDFKISEENTLIR